METGGRFFVYSCCCFLSFCGGAELVLRRFVSGDKRDSGTDWATPPRLFMSLSGSTQTHTDTSPCSCILFSLRRPIVEAPSLPPLPPEGSSVNKGKQACFCLGCRPQAIPPSWLYPASVKDQQRPPPSLSHAQRHSLPVR